jgi:murein DD-endopeptidase MepM/ murein hydrolase activator NlpD
MPPIRDAADAARALEATLVKQLVASSGAFKGNEVAGSQLHAEMFVEALADAVAQSGGFGLAKMLEQTFAAPGQDGGEAPAPEPAVTSGFGPRVHPLDGVAKMHTGVDLRGGEGAPIHAAAGGTVVSAGERGGYGNAVEIDHGGGVHTLYAHASALEVKPGDHVQEGQEVGQVGQTGRATGPHLHFEVRVGGRPVDPTSALKAYGIRADILSREHPLKARGGRP